ncbi:YtxH domain-containing protein [Clostridium paridis]|uniref:YtxH domain-containing protein n=1 Tax=Clostridium paridis TaxID=2803863 RepID=A0A937FHN9_9CLOT|nr:YtxH domain-containing protein [Clostridium paridis]MBL4932197.1 YtxH domain-containing protein [Clostridium paridis]
MGLKGLIEEKRKAQQRKKKIETAKKVTLGAAAGVTAGVVGGILLAPKSGKETRNDIKEGYSKANENIKLKVEEAKNLAMDKKETTVSNIKEAKSKISSYLEEKKNKITASSAQDVINEAELNTETFTE